MGFSTASSASATAPFDEQMPNDTLELPLPADHDNVRGPSCFH